MFPLRFRWQFKLQTSNRQNNNLCFRYSEFRLVYFIFVFFCTVLFWAFNFVWILFICLFFFYKSVTIIQSDYKIPMTNTRRPYILIREFKRGDDIPRKELIKQYVMSFAFDAFLSCLFREVSPNSVNTTPDMCFNAFKFMKILLFPKSNRFSFNWLSY